MRMNWLGCLFGILIAIPLFAVENAANGVHQSGGQVATRGAACHAPNVTEAPKLGDQTDRDLLIGEGQHITTAHGWAEMREMQLRGGDGGHG